MAKEKRKTLYEFSQRQYREDEEFSYKKKGFFKGFTSFFYRNTMHLLLHIAFSIYASGPNAIFTLPFTLPLDYIASVNLAEINNYYYYLDLIDIIQTANENDDFKRGQEIFQEMFPKDKFIYNLDEYWHNFRSTNLFVFRGPEYRLYALCDKSYLGMHGLGLDQKLWDVKLWPEHEGTILKFSQHVPEYFFYHCYSPYNTPRYYYNWSLHMFSYELFAKYDIHSYYPYVFFPFKRSFDMDEYSEFSDWESRQYFKRKREERSSDYSKKLIENMRNYFKQQNLDLNFKKPYIPHRITIDLIKFFWEKK